MSDRTHLLALLQMPGLGLEQVRWLVEVFGSPAGVFDATPQALIDEGVAPELAQAIAHVDESLLWSLEDQLADYEDATGVRFLAMGDAGYPPNLCQMEEPPLFLWMRGTLEAQDDRAVAVVGAWRATPRGLSNAGLIGMRLAEQGYTVVGGVGDEIDMRALQGARDGGGRGLGVLAGGIEMIAPEQQNLANRLIEKGALLSRALRPSDYPNRMRAQLRDDVIVGLARAVIIVESLQADDRGIEMAFRAHNAGRPILVVQPRDEVPDGNRELIDLGATPITHIGMMFEMLEETIAMFDEMAFDETDAWE